MSTTEITKKVKVSRSASGVTTVMVTLSRDDNVVSYSTKSFERCVSGSVKETQDRALEMLEALA